jgi:hypothetical protein
MARLSIYVTEELKARMDEVGDNVNWSEVVRPAIQTAVATYEHRKSPNMNTAIERLRASKLEAQQADTIDGKTDGRKWAESDASYTDLCRISEIMEGRDFESLKHAIDPQGNLDINEIFAYTWGESFEPSKDYIAAFIEGAQEFFAEVRNKL